MSTVTIPADKFDTNMTFTVPANAPTRAPLPMLKVLPGFNTRVKDDEYRERVATIAESIVNHGFFNDKPFAVVQIDGDDTIYVYDGEHRLDAANAALLDGAEFPDGLPIAWAKDGATVKDLTIHLAHGNNGERLNMVESAAVVRRMQQIGMDKAEIAAAFGRTGRHIDNLFVLAAANQTVKKAVASGKIAGAEAVKLLRKDPKTAGEKIAAAVKAAEEKGKAKATPKTMQEGGAPATAEPKRKTKLEQGSINFQPGSVMGDNLKSFASLLRGMLEINADGDLLLDEGVLVRFSVSKVDKVAEAEAAKAAEEKAVAAAAKQKEREEKAAKAAAEKAEKQAKKDAEAKDKAEKKAAQTALLAEAAAGKGKTTTPKKGQGPKPLKDALANAKEHLSGDKAPEAVKPARTRKKAVESDSTPPATTPAPEGESASGGASLPPEDSMGGL